MPRYHVHLYRVMRVYFPAIEASTPEEAARIAADRPTEEAFYTEDCNGDDLDCLIDFDGDDDFTRSVTVEFDAGRLLKAAPNLLEALKTLADQADQDCPAEYRTRHFTDALEQAHAVIAEATTQQSDRRPV